MNSIFKFLLIALTILNIHIFFDAGIEKALGASCDALDESECDGVDELPTAEACESDSCSCAQQIVCLLGNENAVDTWPTVPNGALEFNDLFFHKRFAQTQVSPDALSAWEEFLDPSVPNVSMPDKTIVIKPAYKVTTDDPALAQIDPEGIYAFIKLDGYCPEDAKVGDMCLGGDWYGLEIQTATEGDVDAGSIPNHGKPTLCFSCHAPVEQEGDWLWHIYIERRYGQ